MSSLANMTPASLFSGDIPALLYDEKTKAFSVSDDKQLVKWNWHTGMVQNTFPFVLGANGSVVASAQIGAEDGLRGDIEDTTFLMRSTGRLTCLPFISSLNKNLASTGIPTNLMFGVAQLPALLPMSVYNLPTTYWNLTLQDLSGAPNTISPVFFGRKFLDRSRERIANQRRVAFLSQFMHTYWLGPVQGYFPEITLGAGLTTTIDFLVPSSADFLCKYILDDSTSSTGLEPVLSAQIFEGQSARGLIDQPNGISWRDFVASPTTTVTGFTGNTVRAISLPFPTDCNTHLFTRSTRIRVQFTSADAGTITLRPVFLGTLIYAPEPLTQQMTQDTGAIQERIAQAAELGANPVRFFGDGGR